MKIQTITVGAVLLGATSIAVQPAAAGHSHFNHPGNVLIADQFNNRVIEVDKKGTIVWSWGLGPNDFSANSILGVNDAERVGDDTAFRVRLHKARRADDGGADTLMAGAGIPANIDPNCPNGCVDNRVILVDEDGNIVWQYGQFGVTGSGYDQLNVPVQATFTPDQKVYITDQGNQRVILVDADDNILWQYGTTGVSGNGYDELNNPNSAELLKNGDVLIADESNNRVIEVNQTSLNVDKTFTAGGTLSGPAFASLLPGGNILIADGGNNRVVEVDKNDNIVFQYATNTQTGSNPNPLPSRAVAGHGKDIVISDQFNNRVIIIDQNGDLLTQYGNLNQSGYGTSNTQQGLYAPYDAKVIGDYKGLTRP